MANSNDYVRKCLAAKPTRGDKGLVATIKIIAYDNGQIYVAGNPMGAGQCNQASANRFIAQLFEELCFQASKRQPPQEDEPAITITVPSLDDAERFLNG